MGNKKSTLKIGLLLTGDYNWVGGLYYVINIIKALNTLDTSKKPDIVVFYNNNTPKEIISEVEILNVKLENIDKYNVFYKAIYKVIRLLTKRNLQLEHIINPHKLDVLYPLSQYFHDLKYLNCEILYWIYDFQHKFLPHLFEQKEIECRDEAFGSIATNAKHIVVSSVDSHNHFNHFYPNSKAKIHVLRFVSMIDCTTLTKFDILKKKYDITSPYFVVANQFWKHKNHIVVLTALIALKEKDLNFKIYFTGKQHDHRNPNYFNDLSQYIYENSIVDYVSFTGFISREDQLALIKNAVAVIQPSKFEGWSTVVEDSKVLNKNLILSGINVHLEQAKKNVTFFDPDSSETLANYILEALRDPSSNEEMNYASDINNFTQNLLTAFSSIV